ncbi:hypothetical protein M378DRAFT_154941 [Amanita muscaria Koide BX008]|uniref:Uncharacterized protein n=1 Tax=Amanita muscaria (strain Koide BX008) TaxID=946122 RepID=A0A0C2TVN0_AMAMK|nr:hypothetical protein M378DRAFT_154941 [Amanita muscaria Koide BX008]
MGPGLEYQKHVKTPLLTPQLPGEGERAPRASLVMGPGLEHQKHVKTRVSTLESFA